ncbi:MAG: DUF488 family protein [Phycisphaerae bacterium]|mgnify:FL=1|nr:DUF488 family protein [Phycisphaerae bacterium]HRT41343.1 DUF488 family protein [Phycisphaerae bacterium]
MIRTQRVYEKQGNGGAHYLVERLWPRGVRKEALRLDGWLREVAPSTELRRWFSHDPAKWAEFRRRYFAELDRNPDAWRPLAEAARRRGVTLMYSSHDTEHNNAVALKEYLEAHLRARPARGARSAAVRGSARK